MIASSIGKTFLNEYNRKNGTSYSAKEFFEQHFVPLFFDYPKYMRSGGNSPLENPKFKKGERPDKKNRAERIQKTIEKIESDPAGSSAIGYPSNDILATTSGQVTNTNLSITPENVYLSWIGSGFGIGVQGGFAIYFDVWEILSTIFEGWQFYRNYLEEIPALRPNQIDTWNGQWLSHVYDPKSYIEEAPTAHFEPFSNTIDGKIEITTQRWVKILFGISQKFPDQQITGYVFNLGQTNTTIGFIQFNLTQIRKPIHFYRILFGENDYLNNAKMIEELLGTEFSFRMSCTKGQIGVHALQPKGLMPFIRIRDGDLKLPNFKKVLPLIKRGENTTTTNKRKNETEEKLNYQYVTYKTYESWIMATLNNETLYEKATKYAQCFIEYEKGAGKGRRDRKNHVNAALAAKDRRRFIDAITEIVKNQKMDILNEMVEEIVNMPVENFPFFLTLIRFRYAYFNEN